MLEKLKEMIQNTINLIGSPLGIFILILFVIIVVEAMIIWLLIWIIKNQFNKNSGGNRNEPATSHG